jgi:pimeloyl-ACP methyl ester carboxylesterase
MRAARRTLLFLGLCVLAVDGFTDEVGIRTFEVPVENNRVSLRTVAQEMLRLGGSEVILPEEFADQSLHLHPATLPLGLMIWNRIMDPFGGKVSVDDGRLMVRVDLEQLEAGLDRLEGEFLDTFGVERNAVLHHLSGPDATGPAVVMVHGLDSGKRLFSGTCTVLVEKGYDVYFFEYPNDDRIERNAFRLSEALKTIPSERRKNLSLITISMGGVISQLMIETPELYVEGVTRLIACVPPFQGSEMAALRGFVEIGDHALDMVFQPAEALDVWGDGMGRAGIDLQPGSLLMEKLDQLERNPDVTYSILAGNRGMFDPAPLRKLRDTLAEDKGANAVAETARRLAVERLNVMLQFQTPEGDGAVSLNSATLEGVTDRVVLPYHHLQFLTGFKAEEENIPALDEVLKRLPPVK